MLRASQEYDKHLLLDYLLKWLMSFFLIALLVESVDYCADENLVDMSFLGTFGLFI